MRSRESKIVAVRGDTVLSTAVDILVTTQRAMGPTEIARTGIDYGWIKIPRGKSIGNVAQTLQTKLQANAVDRSSKSLVYRPKKGKYCARARAY